MIIQIPPWHSLIQGKYENKRQAQSNPSEWPHIIVKNTLVEDGIIELKSWYKYKGEADPYGQFHLSYRYDDDGNCHTTSVNTLTGEPTNCPWHWGFYNGWWWGEPAQDCLLNGALVQSHVRFNGQEYRSRDTGVDPETKEFKWGNQVEKGEFYFTRINT